MPIDYRNYPPDWKEIRARILTRAGNRCERCGVPNLTVIRRVGDRWWCEDDVEQMNADDAEALGLDAAWPVRIVLTIAHLPEATGTLDGREEVLAALCQRCHLRLDAPMHGRNAARTRARKRREEAAASGQLAMEEATTA